MNSTAPAEERQYNGHAGLTSSSCTVLETAPACCQASRAGESPVAINSVPRRSSQPSSISTAREALLLLNCSHAHPAEITSRPRAVGASAASRSVAAACSPSTPEATEIVRQRLLTTDTVRRRSQRTSCPSSWSWRAEPSVSYPLPCCSLSQGPFLVGPFALRKECAALPQVSPHHLRL